MDKMEFDILNVDAFNFVENDKIQEELTSSFNILLKNGDVVYIFGKAFTKFVKKMIVINENENSKRIVDIEYWLIGWFFSYSKDFDNKIILSKLSLHFENLSILLYNKTNKKLFDSR